ncbi:MAG: hypothetical protein QG629_693 [Patescibacteria group bacterium]|nr:diacylglycerol kinase [Candidatus Saccharibacteria bacterium]MDQ5963610.1 hypothetical protein [Patescibacteria group bacterium]
MRTFDHIALIYNPKSKGDAVQKAEMLQRALARRKQWIGARAVLVPTQHAGHAKELAKEISLAHKRPLIISVSGDGGYNEVVNGAMEAKRMQKHAHPVVAVHSAGNANDHKRALQGGTSLTVLIRRGDPKPIDLLLFSAHGSGSAIERYAHSYISLGLTSEVAHKVNAHGKGFWREAKQIYWSFTSFTPLEIVRFGRKRRLHNIVFANIHTMAKVVQLDTKSTVQDGKFEVIALTHHGKVRMLLSLVRAVLLGFRNPPSKRAYRFSVVREEVVQLDGETEKIPAKSTVRVSCQRRAIETLY